MNSSFNIDWLDLSAFSIPGLGIVAMAWGIFVFVVNVIMALAVNGDAKRLVKDRGGLYLFGPFLWGWIAFIFGIAGFALYWAIHHSSLRAASPPHARVPRSEQNVDPNA